MNRYKAVHILKLICYKKFHDFKNETTGSRPVIDDRIL